MRVALEALDDVSVADDVLEAVNREVTERTRSPLFVGVRDLRLRLRQVKGALLCIVAVGFSGGDLVTSTATSKTPLEAIVGALDALPERIERIHQPRSSAPAADRHAAVRAELTRLLG